MNKANASGSFTQLKLKKKKDRKKKESKRKKTRHAIPDLQYTSAHR